jgi:hypothetical protein
MALRLFSPAVSHGLKYLFKKCGFSTDLLATAKFIETMAWWFELVSSRHPSTALSKHNPTKYMEAISFLEAIIELFKDIKIGKGFKPVQKGIIITTQGIIAIQFELLNEYGFRWVLTARFSQDSLENLFSMIRSKNPVPTPKEFKYNLRAICIAQYLKEHKNSNYTFDNRDCLAEFLDRKKANAKGKKKLLISHNSLIAPHFHRKIHEKNIKKKFRKHSVKLFFIFLCLQPSAANLESACQNLGGLGPLVWEEIDTKQTVEINI